MRNYIILNGQNSNDINGLLIQSLPPITKPLMRTQVEEIDGRDGDIVTKLGFSAYNKEFTVGLYGDYNVDEVIGYFNSEGVVTFSNEPDKYYKYQILEQIDFERLIRFKTATVKMHCQPFKYSTTETPAVFENVENLVSIPDFTKTTNSITVNVKNGVISVEGTGSAATEFYIPITSLSLTAGDYVMRALGSGTSPEACSVRVIYNSPSNANSFAGTYATLLNNTTVTLDATLTGNKSYNYIYLYITPSVRLDFTLDLRVTVTEGLVEGEGNFINMKNTSLALFKQFGLKGDTDQQTYSGKNLFNVPSSYSIVGGGTDIKTLFANYEIGKTYTISCGSVTRGGTNNPVIRIVGASTEYLSLAPNSSITFTINSEITHIYTYSSGSSYAGSVGKTSIVENLMIEKNDHATAYEPYVGGIPSPSPNYPQDVQIVTGEQTIYISGKNMFNANKSLENKYLNSSGGWTTSTYSYINQEYKVTGSSELSFSYAKRNGSPIIRVGEYKTDGTFIKRTLVTSSLTLTLDALTNKIIFSVDNLSPNYFDDLQIELSSSPTSYQPYAIQSYTIDLGSTELCKIGDYQDYIYKSGDDWYLHNEISKVMLDSTIEWVTQSYGGHTYVSGFNQHDFDDASISESSVTVLSNQFTSVSWNDRVLNYPNSVYINVSNQSHPRLELRNTSWANVGSVVAWFTSNPATVYFVLATATDTQITDNTLLAQLETLTSQAYSYNEATNLVSMSSDLPIIMSVKAIREDKATIFNSGNTTAKPVLTIYGTGDIGVYLNGSQIFKVALGDEGHITIDTNLMEAYKDTPNNLKNRLVDGDYTNFALVQGESLVTFSGSVDRCVIENYSRWL